MLFCNNSKIPFRERHNFPRGTYSLVFSNEIFHGNLAKLGSDCFTLVCDSSLEAIATETKISLENAFVLIAKRNLDKVVVFNNGFKMYAVNDEKEVVEITEKMILPSGFNILIWSPQHFRVYADMAESLVNARKSNNKEAFEEIIQHTGFAVISI